MYLPLGENIIFSKKVIIYTRVSTSNQRDDLKNQVEFLRRYANAKGIKVDEVMEEHGKRKSFVKRRVRSR